MTIIGVHTPETRAEREVDRLRAKLREQDLPFAVAVDNGLSNWKAWSNRWWPSVYLVDRQGNVRSWWYGELNSKDVNGDLMLRGRIEELLAEDR